MSRNREKKEWKKSKERCKKNEKYRVDTMKRIKKERVRWENEKEVIERQKER